MAVIFVIFGVFLVLCGGVCAVFANLAFTGNLDDSGRVYTGTGIFFCVVAFLFLAGATVLFIKAHKAEISWRSKKEAIRLDSKLAEAHSNLGAAYKDQGKPDEAIKEFGKALKINPNDAVSHYNLADICKDQGKITEAIEHLEIFVRMAPPEYASQVKMAKEAIAKLKQSQSA